MFRSKFTTACDNEQRRIFAAHAFVSWANNYSKSIHNHIRMVLTDSCCSAQMTDATLVPRLIAVY